MSVTIWWPVLLVVLGTASCGSSPSSVDGASAASGPAASDAAATASEVIAECAPHRVADFRGSTGAFGTYEQAVGSVVDDPAAYELLAESSSGQVLFGDVDGDDDAGRLVELYADGTGWAVSAVMDCQ